MPGNIPNSDPEHPVSTDGESILCPHPGCNFQFLAPIKVSVNRGGEITHINSKGTEIKQGEPAGRGVEITIYYQGECGHISVMRQQFYKGCTSLMFDSLGELTDPEEDGELTPAGEVIWRD